MSSNRDLEFSKDDGDGWIVIWMDGSADRRGVRVGQREKREGKGRL